MPFFQQPAPNYISVSLKHFYISLIVLILTAVPALAINPEFYATSSRMAEGRWVKVEVKETGMQFISNSTLKGLGFSNPDKVNVYGYGGRMLPERLDTTVPDDLPLAVSLRTPAGIVFFGHCSTDWELSAKGEYSHISNPYSDHSYYFLSDRDEERPVASQAEEAVATDAEPISVFTECLLHEQDILAPYTSGRVILGEDFRTQRTRTFNFQLPDNTGVAKASVVFGARVSNGMSTVNVRAIGTDASGSVNIPGTSNSTTFLNRNTCSLSVESGEKLSLEVAYTNSGTLFTAALDYIEVSYPRQLRLRNDELYFRLNPSSATEVVIEGCSDATILWDVTDPVSPKAVTLHQDSGDTKFVTPGGERRYIAFNPGKVTRTATGAGVIRNQNLHAMDAPGMLIVSPEQYRTQALRIADLHAKTDGLQVSVVSPEEVYNEFSSGTPDVTAFRRLLKMWYDKAGGNPGDYTAYCLLFSRPTYDNKLGTPLVKRAGYPRIPIWQEPGVFTESGSYSTDDYIGMLDDQPGTLSLGNSTIHVAVGRMPVKSVAEAETAVSKLEKYLLTPTLGTWRNNVMLIADDQDNGQHLEQAEKVIANMRSGENGSDLIYEKLYLDSYPLGYSGQGAVYPEAKQRMMDKIAEGVSLIDYIGHANPKSWGHENLLTWTDITSMTNRNLPFLYAATCAFMYWDADEVSGAEEMWLTPEAGVIGMICPSRTVYISANGTLNAHVASWMFKRGADGLPLRLGEIMINGKNNFKGDTNKLRYGFMGDPAMRLPYPGYKVELTTINGKAASGQDDYPELQARSRVRLSGRISDIEGNTAEDFNGTIEIQLYDAEKVVETYGNGTEGKVCTYNDRKTRLFTGRTTVSNGYWETEFIMPSEIENNYSPALISLYAMNENGDEANGSNEQLYVYGFDTTATDDTDGPAITDFYINELGFKDGSAIGPNPVVYASFSDPSGINLSEAGIGHRMTISVDGKDWYDDLDLYYAPDVETFEKGKISYPLQGIEPGDHTLTLTVWDTANNSSSASLNFSVRADWKPSITELTTDVNPATTSVNFLISVDGSLGKMGCTLEVYDLGGKLVWSADTSGFSESVNSLSYRWDLRDSNGRRVPRGIYLYRSTVTTPEGHVTTKTRKLAVTS